VQLLNLSLSSPAENLACDEALLDRCENDGIETLRFWESPVPFIVVGYGNSIAREVNVAESERRGVSVLRRCSGGGTVVQGPGCLNYNLTLRMPESGPLTTVTGTNEFVMERNRAALASLLGVNVAIQGHTDLAFEAARAEDRAPDQRWLKFSGNAQRRRRHSLVFHGTVLYAFDLSLIDALLNFPSAQPDYRASRSHREFVRNVAATPQRIQDALSTAWSATDAAAAPPREQIDSLVREHYGNREWNWRR
jgi:lipoate---protein ligase